MKMGELKSRSELKNIRGLMITLLKNIQNSEFVKNVFPLFLGSSAGQIILVLLTPIITRIYSPESYGALVLYLAVLSMLSIVANARYELAIMLPKDIGDAKSLLFLSVSISLMLSMIIGVILYAMFSFFFSDAELIFLYFLVPGMFLTGLFQVLTVWNNRLSKFRTIANANIVQTGTTATAQILLGTFKAQSFSLILGSLMGLLAGVLTYTKGNIFRVGRLVRTVDISQMTSNAHKYREFPYYSMFGALVISVALQSPILLISVFFDAEDVGQYGLASRIVLIPLVLLSTAIFQVMLKKVSVLANDNFSEIRPYLINKFILLTLIGLPALIVLHFWGETLFSSLFGQEWAVAGKFAEYLSWAAYFKFSINPLMAVFNLQGLVKMGAYWQTLYFCTLSLTLSTLWFYKSEVTVDFFIQIFVLHEIILSLICLCLVAYVTSPNKKLLNKGL